MGNQAFDKYLKPVTPKAKKTGCTISRLYPEY